MPLSDVDTTNRSLKVKVVITTLTIDLISTRCPLKANRKKCLTNK